MAAREAAAAVPGQLGAGTAWSPLLTALYRLLSEELLDVGYSLLPLEVTAPARYSLFKALSWLPALVLLVLPALALLCCLCPASPPFPPCSADVFGCLELSPCC